MIYLDYAATTPVDEAVAKTYAMAQTQIFANPESIHELGTKARNLVEGATDQIAKILAIKPTEIFYTSSATEANNLAIFGIAKAYQDKGKHIITTAIEHASVIEPIRQLEKEGYAITVIPVAKNGVINVQQVLGAIRSDTILISIMHVNNEIGTIQPVSEIGKRLKEVAPKIIFHVDMAQSFGKIRLDLLNIDCATFSGHKFFAPKGIGILMKKRNVQMAPLFFGGLQQERLRPGTMDAALIAACAKAMRLADQRVKNQQVQTKISELEQELVFFFQGRLEVVVFEALGQRVPHILNITIQNPKAEIETYINALGAKDVYVSSRSTCHTKDLAKANPILMAVGFSPMQSRYALRISLCHLTTQTDIKAFVAAYKSIDKILKK
ncbi:MAG: cysteine desulfurase family protein [Culicoidibacterales bacterium]